MPFPIYRPPAASYVVNRFVRDGDDVIPGMPVADVVVRTRGQSRKIRVVAPRKGRIHWLTNSNAPFKDGDCFMAWLEDGERTPDDKRGLIPRRMPFWFRRRKAEGLVR